MRSFEDQMGDVIEINGTPKRIISLVPSKTELLFDLGLEDRIVGVTKFCVHPKNKVKNCANVGGTKKFNLEKIHELNPDFIIGNKEENYKEGIVELKMRYPVWMSDISDLNDAYSMMLTIGEITNKNEEAIIIVNEIKSNFKLLNTPKIKKTALYLIWKKPYMAVGNDNFINEILLKAGFKNIVSTSRYPEIDKEELLQLDPEFIFLSSEPFPFKEEHIVELQDICPSAHIRLVDGELFSWYGSRLKFTPEYLQQLSC